jgi:uncharacterized membrane protein
MKAVSRAVTLLIAILFVLPAPPASAKPEYLELLQAHFKAASAKISERACASCHVSSTDFGLNPFGKQVAHEKVAVNARTLTDAVLLKVATMDANGDGVSNEEEFNAGKDPAAAVAGGAPKAEPAPEPPKEKPLIPKNAFHPAIVHFPIALFLGGIVLDAAGYRRRNTKLLCAGWYNLLFASVTTFGALVSGYVATLFMKIPISGLIQQHMIFALVATGLMWVMVGLRAKRHEKLQGAPLAAYFLAAAAAAILVSWSGHLGGLFVYGE